MPNICNFSIEAEGKPEDLKEFMKYFVFGKEIGKKKGKYLARTFLEDWNTRADFLKDHAEGIKNGHIEFYGWCAWSCYSCWISGYPDDSESAQFIKDLCKKHKVSISVSSSEDGLAFTEAIECDKEGNITDKCEDYPYYECLKCKNVQQICPGYDMRDELCYECDELGEWKPTTKPKEKK
jgi:hypothetical protein